MAHISSAGYVTAVLQFLQAFNRGDLDACEQLLDPDVEWHAAASHCGRADVREMLETLSERFSRVQARPEDFREASGHVLMVLCFYEADPNAQPHEERHSWVTDIGDDGLLRRVISYPSPADAARALEGLAAAVPKVPA
jgi:ketosteroid isomerase-like protein